MTATPEGMGLSENNPIPNPYRFEARAYQKPIWNALEKGCKRALWVSHRRSGKDLTIFNWCVKKLIEKRTSCFYLLPSYKQAKKIIWDGLTKDGTPFLEYIHPLTIDKTNESELKIKFYNGSYLQLIGSDNVDTLVGTSPQIIVFSEAALQSHLAWDYMRPILVENDGVAIFVSTPRGRNWFYDLFNHSKRDADWYCEVLGVEDTKALDPQFLTKEKEQMSEDLYAQEYDCSFSRGIEGSFYGKLLDNMHQEGRITNVPLDLSVKVHTAWDLGISDAMTIIFFQVVGQEVHIIDYIEGQGEGLHYYIKELDKRDYLYGQHFAPHDIKVRELGTGVSRLEIAHDLGLNFEVVPNLPLADGIEALRVAFKRIWIDARKCEHLIKCLMNYRKDFLQKQNCYSDRPIHDWTSHAADCARYMAISL